MGSRTKSENWGAVSVANVTGAVGLGARGTVFVFRNADNDEKFLFFLASLGFGLSFGVRIHQEFRSIFRAVAKNSDFNDPDTYTTIVPNYAFSADDLAWSPGAEATIGLVVFVDSFGASSISAWPFFQGAPKPGQEVNNDYFSGQVIYSKTDIGLSANANYQFLGRWFKVYSF
jgi:hypothetical protein